MNVVRWNPLQELEDISDRLNRVFSRNAGRGSNGRETMMVAEWFPSVDISETHEAFHLAIELPEVKREEVKVSLEGGVLTILGERKSNLEEKGHKIHRVERSYGRFVRSFSLPNVVDETKVTAEFKDGVLHVNLPKLEKAQPKAIEVKVAA